MIIKAITETDIIFDYRVIYPMNRIKRFGYTLDEVGINKGSAVLISTEEKFSNSSKRLRLYRTSTGIINSYSIKRKKEWIEVLKITDDEFCVNKIIVLNNYSQQFETANDVIYHLEHGLCHIYVIKAYSRILERLTKHTYFYINNSSSMLEDILYVTPVAYSSQKLKQEHFEDVMKYIDRALKIQELAYRGEGGEKETAQRILTKSLTKTHRIAMPDNSIIKIQSELNKIQQIKDDIKQLVELKDLFKDVVFILDYSSSMNGMLPDGKRAIQHLVSAVSQLKIHSSSCVSFSNKANIGIGLIDDFMDGTSLDKAFKFVKDKFFNIKRVVLVSDGEPNDVNTALQEAMKLKIPIDVVYIGQKETSGERFMEMLCLKTHGQTITLENITVGLLKEKIIYLLKAGK